jgi:hypothetical protein
VLSIIIHCIQNRCWKRITISLVLLLSIRNIHGESSPSLMTFRPTTTGYVVAFTCMGFHFSVPCPFTILALGLMNHSCFVSDPFYVHIYIYTIPSILNYMIRYVRGHKYSRNHSLWNFLLCIFTYSPLLVYARVRPPKKKSKLYNACKYRGIGLLALLNETK